MNEAKWLELRTSSGFTDRSLVEEALKEFYEVLKWKAFDYVLFRQDWSSYSRNLRSRHLYGVSQREVSGRLNKLLYTAHHGGSYPAYNHAGQTEHFFAAEGVDPLASISTNFNILNRRVRNSSALNGPLEVLYQHCVDFIPGVKVVTALEKPLEMHFDDQGRLHNLDGPAILWPSGMPAYAAHGVSFNSVPKRMSLRRIRDESNSERRRILIEIYGWDRYLKEMKAKLLDDSEFGKLWSYTEMINWNSVERRFVEVVNSTPEPNGEYRRFFLHVPTSMRTAKAAVAWTFDVPEDQYEPAIET